MTYRDFPRLFGVGFSIGNTQPGSSGHGSASHLSRCAGLKGAGAKAISGRVQDLPTARCHHWFPFENGTSTKNGTSTIVPPTPTKHTCFFKLEKRTLFVWILGMLNSISRPSSCSVPAPPGGLRWGCPRGVPAADLPGQSFVVLRAVLWLWKNTTAMEWHRKLGVSPAQGGVLRIWFSCSWLNHPGSRYGNGNYRCSYHWGGKTQNVGIRNHQLKKNIKKHIVAYYRNHHRWSLLVTTIIWYQHRRYTGSRIVMHVQWCAVMCHVSLNWCFRQSAHRGADFILFLFSAHLLPSLQRLRWNFHRDLGCPLSGQSVSPLNLLLSREWGNDP